MRSVAQSKGAPVARIGFLGPTSAESFAVRLDALREGLRERGYVDGSNIVIEVRFADGKYDRLPALAQELVRLKVDVIVTPGTPPTLAAKDATTSIPVVMTLVGDALATGIVSNLARPAGNVTGMTFFLPELSAKRVELLKEALPGLSDVAVLVLTTNPAYAQNMRVMQDAARAVNVNLFRSSSVAPTIWRPGLPGWPAVHRRLRRPLASPFRGRFYRAPTRRSPEPALGSQLFVERGLQPQQRLLVVQPRAVDQEHVLRAVAQRIDLCARHVHVRLGERVGDARE